MRCAGAALGLTVRTASKSVRTLIATRWTRSRVHRIKSRTGCVLCKRLECAPKDLLKESESGVKPWRQYSNAKRGYARLDLSAWSRPAINWIR